jgi:predicted protein tyrosine phosphatase
MSALKRAPQHQLTSSLHVCGLAAVPDTVNAVRATHLMTVINAQTQVDTPREIESARHLKIAINDISVPQDGLVHPREDHIVKILQFARDWDHSGPMVVHCWAGISRSTAAAFITLCALNPDSSEAKIANQIRAASSTATPNALMVSIADDLLGRGGKMVDAVLEIGQGQMAMAGIPFTLRSRIDTNRRDL